MLFAYAVQLLSVSAHAASMLDLPLKVSEQLVAMSGCHEDKSDEAAHSEGMAALGSKVFDAKASCCDGLCSMASCSSAPALLSSYIEGTFSETLLTTDSLSIHFPVEPIGSLYRPPMLG